MKLTIGMASALFLQLVCLSADVSAQIAQVTISKPVSVSAAAAPTSTPVPVVGPVAAPIGTPAPVALQLVALVEPLGTGMGNAHPPGDCSNHARIFSEGPYDGGYYCSVGRFLDCSDSEYQEVFFPLSWLSSEILWPMFPGGIMLAGFHYRYEWRCDHPEPGHPSYSGDCYEHADFVPAALLE